MLGSTYPVLSAIFETAKKRKSRSEFRCGFLFEEPGGFGGLGGEPGFVRPEAQNPSSAPRAKSSRPATAGAACRRSTAPRPRTPRKPNRHIMVEKKNNKHMVGSLARS